MHPRNRLSTPNSQLTHSTDSHGRSGTEGLTKKDSPAADSSRNASRAGGLKTNSDSPLVSGTPEGRSDDEIRALCQAATPGPWTLREDASGEFYGSANQVDVYGTDGDDEVAVTCGGPWEEGGPYVGALDVDDARFIAAARRVVPSLLARVEAAEAENAELRAENQRLQERIEGQASTISTLWQLAAEAGQVMEMLQSHGAGLVRHLLDTDDNPGERLRELLREVSLWTLRDGTSWRERAEVAEAVNAGCKAVHDADKAELAAVRAERDAADRVGAALADRLRAVEALHREWAAAHVRGDRWDFRLYEAVEELAAALADPVGRPAAAGAGQPEGER